MTLTGLAAVFAPQFFSTVLTVLGGLVALGVVVIIHELGHFISAKRTGIKVEVFSVGFGPRIWGIKRGETEYRISLIFFGGYVRMKGMEAEKGKEPHEIEGGFFAAKPGRRALVAFAAPAMNVLLALAVFTVLWLTGRKVPQEFLTTSIGYFEEGSPAREAGLVPGDTILKINGKAVHEWKDVIFDVAFSPVNPVLLTVRHDGAVIEKQVVAEWDKELGVRRLGIHPRMDLLVAGVQSGSLAEKMGLKKEDRFVSLAGERLYHIDQFREILRKNIGEQVDLVVARTDNGPGGVSLSFIVPPPEDGIWVRSVRKGSPAGKAGLRSGDIIVAAGGTEVSTIAALEEMLNAKAAKQVRLEVLRQKSPPGPYLPSKSSQEVILGAQLEEGFPVLGFIPDSSYGIKKENPLFATYSVVKNVLLTLRGLVTRTVSAKGLSGPVGIVGMIAKSISVSFTTFLYFIGFLSVNLAVLNLLPIPVVDGGHIMFSGIEKVRGKPMRQKTMVAIVNIFVALIVAFFVFVTWNDIVRVVRGGRRDVSEKKVLSLRVPDEGVSPRESQDESEVSR